MTKKSEIRINWLLYYIQKYHLAFLIFVLLSASLYYFVGATRFKIVMNSNAPDIFKNKETVKILEVIDGDEVLITNSDGVKTVLRILGIKSFNPTVSDPMLSEYGKICFNYLKGLTINQQAHLEIAEKRLDDEGRLLGSVYVKDDNNEFTVDVAKDLINKGYTLVYTRYDFTRMDEYLAVQNLSRQEKHGFWSNPQIASRADSMLKMWTQERLDD